VSAQTRLLMPDLPPADTMNAVLEFESGLTGSYTVTYAAAVPFPSYLTIVGETGTLRVTAGHLEVSENGKMQEIAVEQGKDVYNELAAFAAVLRDDKPNNNPPLEALRDVAVLEAMLKSGATGKRVEVENLSDLEN
jgi:predicted dehydrogenase